jgi:hypothetical protein
VEHGFYDHVSHKENAGLGARRAIQRWLGGALRGLGGPDLGQEEPSKGGLEERLVTRRTHVVLGADAAEDSHLLHNDSPMDHKLRKGA